MNTREVLEAAYHLLDDKRRWTQKFGARKANFAPVDPRDVDACCWCAAGAIFKVGDADDVAHKACFALEAACLSIYKKHYETVNDRLGYRAIRAAFRRAIKEAK